MLYSTYHVFIEMDKMNGGTLESFIKKHKKERQQDSGIKLTEQSSNSDGSPMPKLKDKVISEEVAASITRDICMGLAHIHKKNFIHRDMKPENILIDEKFNKDGTQPEEISDRYRAKVADFGLSAEVNTNVFKDNINEVTGTILFMAPEQATG